MNQVSKLFIPVLAMFGLTWEIPAKAASHREAPLIALDPSDGPNYFNFNDEVLYAINIDNDKDGKADDIVYEFRFKNENRPIAAVLDLGSPLPYLGNPNIPVAALQGITALDGPGSEGLTRRQTYSVTEVRHGKRTELFKGRTLVAVPSNAGPATCPTMRP
jgi:hypothetical protein